MYTEIFNGFTYGERLLNGVLVFLSGMIMVFFVLTLLMFLIKFMGWAITKSAEKKKNKLQQKDTDHTPAETVVEAAQPEEAPDETPVIAAIIAAITAFRKQNGNTDSSFRVVSFKKSEKIRK
ncbi:MAG TPA: OadG family protein [Bacillota bacterium]|nr:OadG family protein [Bacillota bacterium]